ncbi:N6-adenosine-specific RNA methylase IME4 [Devosia crocina]|uniref:N6-adenosine-specific RNA methylase IME4 n=1 Tax=Devosia crocina TaxID=429728 RepID=A0A1I7NEX9_9HYPH|nr:MT-A70 family methyltransferase [Devosia crocina]SFV33224.1 N6-adenosine-specific RNA methylase IME4 [Devosia crocina]
MTNIARTFAEMRPLGGYRVILADPPWLFGVRSAKGEAKAPQAHYDCMPTDEICALPVDVLAADDCALFMWVTWPLMPDWMRVIEAWGFSFSGLAWEWIKFNPATGKYAFGPGYGTRKNLEPCLLCTRGEPSLRQEVPADLFAGVTAAGTRSVRDFIECAPFEAIRAPRREHSRKPDEQYSRIETLFDGPYVELFARQKRPGWASWGNQTEKFEAEEVA